MKKEIWKDIPDYEGHYQVSNLGSVKSLKGKQERVLNKKTDGRGYFVTRLYKNGIRKEFKTHKLVAMVFLGHSPCGYNEVVDHIDNNSLNNNVENLQLITQRENASKDSKNKTGFIGVHINGNGFRSEITINGVAKRLGTFKTPEEAHKAYINELNKL